MRTDLEVPVPPGQTTCAQGQTQQGRDDVRLFQSLALVLSEQPNPPEAFGAVLALLCKAHGWALAEAWFPSVDGAYLERGLSWTRPGLESAARLRQKVRYRRGEGIPGRVWAEGQPLLGSEGDPRLRSSSQAEQPTILAVPVPGRRQIAAVLAFFLEGAGEDKPSLLLLLSAAAQLGVLLERHRADEALHSHAKQNEAVAELSHQAVASVDLMRLAEEVISTVASTLDTEYSEVWELLPEGDTLRMMSGTGWKEAMVGKTCLPAAAAPLAESLRSGKCLAAAAPGAIPGQAPGEIPLLRDEGIASSIWVAIPGRAGQFGVLAAHTRTRRSFSQDDAHFLQTVANVLAAAIERKRSEEAHALAGAAAAQGS